MTDKCPACGLDKGYFKDDVMQPAKSQCRGCGTIFFNKDRGAQSGNPREARSNDTKNNANTGRSPVE